MGIWAVFEEAKAIFSSISAAWPFVTTVVQDVENVLAGSPGSTKLKAVHDMLASIWGTITGVVADFEKVWPSLSAAVAGLVALYNAAGIFHHSAK